MTKTVIPILFKGKHFLQFTFLRQPVNTHITQGAVLITEQLPCFCSDKKNVVFHKTAGSDHERDARQWYVHRKLTQY